MYNPIEMNNIGIPIQQMNPYQDKMDRYFNLQQQSMNTQRQNTPQVSNSSTNMNFVVVENMQKAKEQIVPYGYTMWMRDSSEPYQYIKSVDQVGTPSFRVLKVEDVTDKILNTDYIQQQNVQYVNIEDFNNLNFKVEQLQNALLSITEKKTKVTKSVEKVGEADV